MVREEARTVVARFFKLLSQGYGFAAAIERAGNYSVVVDADVELRNIRSVAIRFINNDTVEIDSNGNT